MKKYFTILASALLALVSCEEWEPVFTDSYGDVYMYDAAKMEATATIAQLKALYARHGVLKIQDDDGYMKMSYIVKAFEYISKAKKLGVNIKAVNCSWGGPGDADELSYFNDEFDKLGALGIITCVSSGNEGINIDQVLADNDSYHALKKIDHLIFTGPTGTNVNDICVALIKRSA